MPIRVFHCDDSRAFTRLAWHWLDGVEGIEHVGAAHSIEEALAQVADSRPDVVLLDTMGTPGDASMLEAVRARVPGARLIVYSGYVSLLGAGAFGRADACLAKGEDERELVDAIRAVAAPAPR
jgi:DNA-binding NarL/FixJ family response regulator